MSSPDDASIDYAALAARYLELWQEQVAKLGQDPAAAARFTEAWTRIFGAGLPPWFAGVMGHAAPPRLQPPPLQPLPRMGPRPLPLHTAVEAWITQLSFAALTLSSGVLPSWKVPAPMTGLPELLPNLLPQALAETHAARVDPKVLDPARLLSAVTAAAKARMDAFATGVARYHAAPIPPRPALPPPVWMQGTAALRSYRADGAPVLVIPSLINRATVLDLSPDRSFLRDLVAAGLATYLLDWDAPGETESAFTLTDYVTRVMIPALRVVAGRHGRPVHVIGYCMGGTLATALALLAPDAMASLTLLAAPWDFHADHAAMRANLPLLRPFLETIIGAHGVAPIDLLQALFAMLDPSLVGRKFRAYAALPPTSEEARRFVALEDWLNDGIPLAGPVARECLFGWYGDNTPGRGQWRIAETRIDPTTIARPAFVIVPAQDRIVPPMSAMALAQTLPQATVRRVPLGHIGMMAGGGAAERVTQPVVAWLQATEAALNP